MRRVVSRGVADTLDFFGWNRRTLFLPALLLVGAVVHWLFTDWNTVIAKLTVTVAYSLVPVGGFAVILLLYNLVRAPALLQAESEQHSQELEAQLNKITDKQDNVDALSDFLSEGIHQIWNRNVTNNTELADLEAFWADWLQRVEDCLRANFTHSDLIHFSRLGVVPLVGRPGAFPGGTHEKLLREYALKESRLREIIRDHNVTHIAL